MLRIYIIYIYFLNIILKSNWKSYCGISKICVKFVPGFLNIDHRDPHISIMMPYDAIDLGPYGSVAGLVPVICEGFLSGNTVFKSGLIPSGIWLR